MADIYLHMYTCTYLWFSHLYLMLYKRPYIKECITLRNIQTNEKEVKNINRLFVFVMLQVRIASFQTKLYPVCKLCIFV